MNDNIDKDEIRRAIDRLQVEHPCHFAFDATKFDSTDNVDVVKRAIDNVMKSIRDDADIHIICEMAKLYLDGVKPTIERPHGKWDRGFCSACGKRSLRTTQTGEIFGIEHTPFCKNCGADMRTKDGQICETMMGW